ncbi:MAG: BamA/TamA family outer membrane protein [Burkholderiales bacterium]|nr:BamA/TamA family outer membrane protein [Burkholderiales bacterium]
MSWRTLFAALSVAVLVATQCGCSSLPFLSKKAEESAAAASPDRAVYALEVEAPNDLRKVLLTYLDLARFQNAPATDSITGVELDRLVAAAPAQARTLLETEGYFNAEVHITRATTADDTPLFRVIVNPGPRTVIDKWSLDVIGDLQRHVAAENEDAVIELAALRRRWGLKAGAPFRQGAWNEAKNQALAQLRAEGYPAATWVTTTARIDAQDNTVTLSVIAESGPLFRMGPITIEGLSRYPEDAVRKLATFWPGEPYSEQLLLDYQDRLQKVGLFEGAVIEIDPNPATATAAPVLIHVKELPMQGATVGVGYSANTGPRLTLEHMHRRVFGRPWIAKNRFELGPKLKSWQGELSSYPLEGLYRNLVSGSAERLESASELRTSWSARVGRAQDTPHIERLYYAELAHSRLDTSAGVANSDAASLNYNWIWRKVDSVLLPTKGITLSLQGAGGYAVGRDIKEDGITEGRGPFTRAYGRITWYKPVGSWYATLRTEGGQVFARDRVGVPDTLLFRAGGDESVRGYAYRTLGPVVDSAVTSGRVLWTGSAEIARPIFASRPAFWWAAFIDAGNAANRWSDLHPALGYGVGFRWRSPVGPLRLDLAYGQNVHQMRVHVSVGVAF